MWNGLFTNESLLISYEQQFPKNKEDSPWYGMRVCSVNWLPCLIVENFVSWSIIIFVGTSENALYIQIWTALIAMLLIKYLQFKSRINWSLSNLVAFLRWNLFTYRNLWQWLDKPFDTLPPEPEPVQYLLPLRFLGQQKMTNTKGNLNLKIAKNAA
jgi:hypothetical protein